MPARPQIKVADQRPSAIKPNNHRQHVAERIGARHQSSLRRAEVPKRHQMLRRDGRDDDVGEQIPDLTETHRSDEGSSGQHRHEMLISTFVEIIVDNAPNTLTFHFDRLRGAGLVSVRRDGRSMIYAARYDTMNALLAYLTENCCKGAPDTCLPAAVGKAARSKRACCIRRIPMNLRLSG